MESHARVCVCVCTASNKWLIKTIIRKYPFFLFSGFVDGKKRSDKNQEVINELYFFCFFFALQNRDAAERLALRQRPLQARGYSTGQMAATFFQSVLIIFFFTWGCGIKLLKGEPVGGGNSLSNQSANKVWSVSGVIWPTSCIHGTKSGVGEAAGAAAQTGFPPGAQRRGINSK